MRSYIAVAACLLSMPIAWLAFMNGCSTWLSAELISCTWFCAGMWLGRQASRMLMTPKQLYVSFREHGTGMPPLARTMVNAGFVIGLLDLPLLFR